VLFLKAKYDNNELLSPADMADLKDLVIAQIIFGFIIAFIHPVRMM
jgi:hypothetical protein